MIIGVTGKKQSGKDTLADYLVANYGYTKIAFADTLKNMVCALFDITREELERMKNDDKAIISLEADWYDTSDRNLDPALVPELTRCITMRVFLKRMGTEAGRNILGKDIWLNIVQDTLHQNQLDKVVISDVRFANEYRDIKNYRDGVIVNIFREQADHLDTHESEDVPPNYDYQIINNHNTLDWFYEEIDHVMESLGEHKVNLLT